MKITGEISVPGPQAAVFNALSDAPSFASWIDVVRDLKEIDATHFDAVLRTRVAYMRLNFRGDDKEFAKLGSL